MLGAAGFFLAYILPCGLWLWLGVFHRNTHRLLAKRAAGRARAYGNHGGFAARAFGAAHHAPAVSAYLGGSCLYNGDYAIAQCGTGYGDRTFGNAASAYASMGDYGVMLPALASDIICGVAVAAATSLTRISFAKHIDKRPLVSKATYF